MELALILVDSDVLIAHLRGVPVARTWLHETRSQHGPIRMSAVSVTEITGGMRSDERGDVRALLESAEIIPVTDTIARKAGAMMREHRRANTGVGLGDYLIAATAATLALDLATLNVRHFPMFPNLTAAFPV